jgi:hypothetical protein
MKIIYCQNCGHKNKNIFGDWKACEKCGNEDQLCIAEDVIKKGYSCVVMGRRIITENGETKLI